MRTVGIRELKNKLSHYIRLVEAGESVLITDRGTVVAEMAPPGATTRLPEPAAGLEALVREGRAAGGGSHEPELYRPRAPALSAGSSKDLLDAERGGR
ncbi:MAG: type II toxin-antitoxin system prevent-host-death family antitoxin [Gemmatimonadetes bacterium]|nr:type II toxin-antitoxin system prevent-host-death family antitoxin [Gemmatimonadota bacterium]